MTNGFLRDDTTGALAMRFVGGVLLSDAVMADVPLGYWRTIDGVDHSGNSLPLTPFGTPTAGTSLDESAPANDSITLNGSNNLWNPEKYAALDLASHVSLSFLMKPGVVDSADVVRKGALYGVNLGGDAKAHARITTGGVAKIADGATTIVVGTTYHVGMSYDGTTVKLYLNGVLDGSLAATGAIDVTNGQSFTIGVNTVGYTGSIDEVALYSTVLTQARFAAHAAAAGV